jgi:hypothetical protein
MEILSPSEKRRKQLREKVIKYLNENSEVKATLLIEMTSKKFGISLSKVKQIRKEIL